jgi:uncharacterized PurR-regulated membrane protein YhhQ (DUF165 family)
MSRTTRRALAAATLAAYIGTVVAANWAITHYGAVPVGFGLLAPAGVYFAGLAFTLRDLAQELSGRLWVLAAIAAGSVLSLQFGPWHIAVAAAVAFAVSELADFAVYQPLRRRRWLTAVAASNAVGLVVDSLIFLWLAFGALNFLAGQVVGKAWVTVAAVAVLAAGRHVLRNRRAAA